MKRKMASEKSQEVQIVLEENKKRSIAYLDGKQIGECDFVIQGDTWFITHTEVLPEYGGQGIARKLVMAIAEAAQAKEIPLVPLCSYAVKVLKK